MEEDSGKTAATAQTHDPESWASQAGLTPLGYMQTPSPDHLPVNNTNKKEDFGSHRYFIGDDGINPFPDMPDGLTTSRNDQLSPRPRESQRNEWVGSWIQQSVAAGDQDFLMAPTMDAGECSSKNLWNYPLASSLEMLPENEAPRSGNSAAFVASSPVSGAPADLQAIGQDGAKPLTTSAMYLHYSEPDLIDDVGFGFDPDFAKFKRNVVFSNPDMSERLADRIAHQQVIRYNRLLAARVNHMRLGANCPCGSLCLDRRGVAITGNVNELLTKSAGSPTQRSGTTKALSNIVINTDSFPHDIPLPPTTTLPAELECQLCYSPQMITNKADWIRHVHQDVQSYTCTWDDCTDPRMFTRKADWLRHENEEHRHFDWWICDVDSCKNKCIRKDDAQLLDQDHQCRGPGLKVREALRLSRNADPTWRRKEKRVGGYRRERPRQPKDEPCKFCAQTFHSWLSLTRHLASHMELMSLSVIRLVNEKAGFLASYVKSNPGKEQELLQKFADDLAAAAESSSFAQPVEHYDPIFSLYKPNESIEQNGFKFPDLEFTDFSVIPMPHRTNDDCAGQKAQAPSLSAQDTPENEARRTSVRDRGRQVNVDGGPDSTDSPPSITPPRHSLDSEPLRRQASSSQSCDETTSTDEWPLLSMEDTTDVDVSKHISQETRSKALLHFLSSFVNWRDYPNFRKCGAGPAQQYACVSRAATTPSLSKGSAASLMPLKRKQGNSEDEDEDENGSRKKKTPNPRAGSTTSVDESKLPFACPFYKWKPLPYRPCRTKVLKEISRVKLHLWRCHKIPIYCPRCFSEFAAEDERDTHIREVNCEVRERKVLEGVTSEQKTKLTRRVNTKLNRRQQWNEMYTILFPGEPLPKNPYISEGLLSQELTALQDFMAKQWPTEFELFIANGGIPAELRGHEDILQAFSASLFEEVVASTMRQFDEWQQKNRAASSSSGYKSDSTPQQEEPDDEDAPALCDPAKTPILPIGANTFATDDEDGYAWALWGSEQLGCDEHSEFNIFEAVFGSKKDEDGNFFR